MKKYIPHGIAVLLLLCLLYQCDKNADLQDLANDNYTALTDSVKYFKNSLGRETASKTMLQLDKKQLQSVLLNKDAELAAMAAEFSKVKTVIKYSTVTKFDTIFTPFKDSIPFVFERRDSLQREWYKFNYIVNQHGLQLNDFTTWTDTRIVTGFKRKWFLGRQTAVTDITNSNPFIKVTDVTSGEIIVPEPWYKKWYIWMAAGIGAGLLVK